MNDDYSFNFLCTLNHWQAEAESPIIHALVCYTLGINEVS